MSYLARYPEGEITPYSPAGQPPEAQDLHRLWSALARRWRLFAAIWAGFVLLVGAITFVMPKSYTTTALLMPGKPSGALNNTSDRDTALPVLNALVLQTGEQSAETLAELARQEDISADVVHDLKLDMTPQALLRHVAVKPVVNTSILNLSISWSDAQTSAQIANDYANVFIDREREFVRSQATAAIGFLTTELPAARQRMMSTAARFADFQAKNGFIDAGAHTQDIVAHAGTIDQKIETLSVDTREAKALLANINSQIAGMSATVDSAKQITYNPVLTDLQTKLSVVNTQLSAAEAQYTDKHPAVVSLRQQRRALLAQIAAQPSSITSGTTTAPNPIYQTLMQRASDYKARIDGNNAQVAQLRQARSALNPLLTALPSQAMQFATLQQEAKRSSDVYNALEQKYSDAIVAQTTAISDITIVQPATADSAVKRPRLMFNVAVAFVVGLLLALGVVFGLDLFERRIRSDVDTRRVFGLPLLGRIPALDPPQQRMLPWVQSMTIEAFLHLCVTLRLKNKRQLRTLAITSACRGDGKSTVALNLGKAMANLQPRVLLVDADMRRPTLHQQGGCSNDIGLSDVLSGERDLAGSVCEIAPNLDLLPSGHEPENPVALLQSPIFDSLLGEAAQQYSMVIVDSPALTSVTDGLLISTRVDGTLLVVAADATDEREARHVVTQFAALGIDNVLGVVLNKDTTRMDDYSDYFAQSFGPALGGGKS
jgi:capsular exopolysaccharide synthesis family protein